MAPHAALVPPATLLLGRIPGVPRIFISYVHEDLAVAEALQKLLRTELALGEEIFLAADETKILAGDVWLELP